MSIKSYFNKLSEKREDKRKYKLLAAAINAGDIDGVKSALAAGASANYLAGSHKKMPLSLALKKGDADIFAALLDTPEGVQAAGWWYSDFRVLKRDPLEMGDAVYFTPSYLYSAIETGKGDIALLLAKKEGVDVDRAGDIFNMGGNHWAMREKYLPLVRKPIDIAREKGMTEVVAVLEERLKPLLAHRALAQAESFTKQADEKRAEAAKLLQEADALQAKAGKPSQAKLNL